MENTAWQNLTDRDKRYLAPERVGAFSDGILAIVITILVLEIRVPELRRNVGLDDALRETWPTFVAFLVSFLIVGAYWIWHRRAFAQVRYANTSLAWLNIAALLPVALMPFVTALLGSDVTNALAIRIYATIVLAAMVGEVAIDLYTKYNPQLLWNVRTVAFGHLAVAKATTAIALYGMAFVVAGVAPLLSVALFAMRPVGYIFLLLAFSRRRRQELEDVDPAQRMKPGP